MDSSHGPIPFIVLEFLQGTTLKELLYPPGDDTPHPLDLSTAFRLMEQVMDALAMAHRERLVHRDLKPANIMVNLEGLPKATVLDFGIAAVTDDVSQSSSQGYQGPTSQNISLGTASYMAPEQIKRWELAAQGEQHYYPQTDIYAWGLIFIEMLTGRVVVRSVSGHLTPEPIPIPSFILEHPLGPLLQRAVEKDHRKRFQSAQDVLRALRELERAGVKNVALVSSRTPAATQPRRFFLDEQSTGRGTDTADTGRSAVPLRHAPGFSRYYKVGLAVFGVVLLVSVVVALTSSSAPDPDPAPQRSTSGPAQREFVTLQAGVYEVGSPVGEVGRSEQLEALRRYELEYDLSVSTHEVTLKDWEQIMGQGRVGFFSNCGDPCPVQGVTWFDAMEYCNALSLSEELKPCYEPTLLRQARECLLQHGKRGGAACDLKPLEERTQCVGYRLPTSEEWEIAARSGRLPIRFSREFNFSSDLLLESGISAEGVPNNPDQHHNVPELGVFAWYSGNSTIHYDLKPGEVRTETRCVERHYRERDGTRCGPQPVGARAPNDMGLHDMMGNVFEWTSSPHPGSDPVDRITRGGSWRYGARALRVARIGRAAPNSKYDDLGFRVVRTLTSER